MISLPIISLPLPKVVESKNKNLSNTGTTLSALRTNNFCIIGTDQQGTLGNKGILDVKKAYKISDHLVVTGAGSSYACETVVKLLKSAYYRYQKELELQKDISPLLDFLQLKLIQSGGMDGILLIATKGMNNLGETYKIYLIDPMGSASQMPLAGIGSGGDLAQGVLKEGYQEELTVSEGVALVKKSIRVSKSVDLYSGGKSHIYVLQKDCTFELIDL